MRRWNMLRIPLLALTATVAVATAPAPPEPLVRYLLAESRRSVSPAGEQASAVRGTVTVLGGAARWDLESGTFPRTTASSVLLGERTGWLVDRKAGVAARAGLTELQSLFVSPTEGESGPFQSTVRDVRVSFGAPASGPAFLGRRMSRHVVSATWSLVTTMPGRVGRVRSRLSAVLDVIAETPAGAGSPLDDLGRLFDVPGAVREALAPELAALRGWPVGVKVETTSEQSVDYPGTTSPPPDGRRPLTTRVETTRSVSDLVSRAAAARDRSTFELPESTRVVGIERLVEPRESLR